MVEDPPTDLAEVVGGTTLGIDPRPVSGIDPRGDSSSFGLLVSYVPDGDYSNRTNPADLCVPPCRETTVVCPLASEPTEPLLGNYQAGQKLEIPGSRCRNPLSTK
jgi:hypothetical protein